ncbi:HAD family hydrolase [Corynebacterium aquatimens]|uniref:HAD superfamily hydrolase (TIGR01490 family) n=1 Tax=Corynebacterium aquatimens TaxID=1190508 RepID=A0A931GSZ9_9CORY|nr:HAD family hydrolase [Corynebacterium aquatimens]MBG6122532.1 HAD superfamily hydrolase (TIGR01490 family) [Corynebacterium aquatimens]WJY64928.1 haloacid dehalogenase-like hydrolase [Corynebacterium aquatimens]
MAKIAAFFDLDKTIIATSSAYAFGRGFMASGLISWQQALSLYLAKTSYMFSGHSHEKMDAERDRLSTMVSGWHVADVQSIIAETMKRVVTPAIYKEARELIDVHAAAGHDLIIISASASILVEPIARELGISTIIASEVKEEDGVLTGELTSYLKGEAKAEAIASLTADNGYDLKRSYAYSDSVTDVPMLEMVGNPVAVNPDRALRKHALDNEWQIMTFKNPEPLVSKPGIKEVGIGASVVATISALTAVGMWMRQRGKET